MPLFTSPAVTARLSPLRASQHAQHTLTRQLQQQQQQRLSQLPFQSRHALLPSLFVRPSSMSAIVRGLRRTFRDPDGKRPPGYNPEVAAHVSERRQVRDAANAPTYRLFRGKKDITDRPVPKAKTRRARFFDPEDQYGKKSLVYQLKSGALEAEVKALSRQQREESGSEDQDGERDERRSFRRDSGREARGGRDGRRGRDGRDDLGGRNNSYGDSEPRSRTRTSTTSFGGREGPRSRQGVTGRRDRGSDRWEDRVSDRRSDPGSDRGSDWRGDRGGDRRGARQPFNRDRAPEGRSDTKPEGRFNRERRQDYDGDGGKDYGRGSARDNGRSSDRNGDGDSVRNSRSHEDASVVPLSISYTTAASQFLYGRSVVEAALRSARRQLYKLYVYGGANRGGAPQDQQASRTIERLATRRNLPMQVVDERWQRLLDKMSKGRPHNGYVLEASPLPQPPLTALGPFTDGTPVKVELAAADAGADSATDGSSPSPSPFTTGPGFRVEVGYQSREEAGVNGASNFVEVEPTTAARGYRPLVLLLDQVLDPGNLGAILRSASFLGVSAVAVSKHSSATLTSVALKASAGASEAMALFSVDAPATFLAQSRKAGWKVYTAVPLPTGGVDGGSSNYYNTVPSPHHRKPVLDLDSLEAADPLREEACILVMGSEGEGLPRAIRREADVEVSIANRSGSNVVDSLNVSVATGLLCASFLKGSTRGGGGRTGSEAAAFQGTALGEPVRERGGEKEEESTVRDELNIW